MTEYEKERVGEWLIGCLKEGGEMPEVRVYRRVSYTESVDVPADVAIQGKGAIDDYIYKSGNGYHRRGICWENMDDYDIDSMYTVYSDDGEELFTTDE